MPFEDERDDSGLTEAEIDAAMALARSGRNARQVQTTSKAPKSRVQHTLAAMISEAERSVGFFDREVPGYEAAQRIKKPAASMRWLKLSDVIPPTMEAGTRAYATPDGTSVVRNARDILSDPASSRITTIQSAAVAGSRTLGAGARLIVLPSGPERDDGTPAFVVGNAASLDSRVIGEVENFGRFSIVSPISFEAPANETDDFHEVAHGDWATRKQISRADLGLYGFTTKVTRKQRFDIGLDQIAAEVATGIASGLGQLFDKILLDELNAATLSAGTALSAAAKGVSFGELRGLIGTTAPAAAQIIEGKLFLGGIPAELCGQTATSIFGAWRNAAICAYEEITITAARLNVNGDVLISAHAGVGPLVADPSFFWTQA